MPDADVVRVTHHPNATPDAERGKVEITRDFRASRARLWRAWTQTDAIVRWLGPRHYPAVEVTADVRVGGLWRACLKAPDTGPLWQSGRYIAIEPMERLEFTFTWEGADHEDGPGVLTHVIVILKDLRDGGTRMHFSQTGLVSSNSANGHSEGWKSTFDRLAAFLRNAAI